MYQLNNTIPFLLLLEWLLALNGRNESERSFFKSSHKIMDSQNIVTQRNETQFHSFWVSEIVSLFR